MISLERSVRKVAKITGCEINIDHGPVPGSKVLSITAYDPELDVSFTEPVPSPSRAMAALTKLHSRIYRAHSEFVYRKQRGRCWFCEESTPVGEIDHIVARSKGRDDRIGNLRWCCRGCHHKRHGG